ncbi:MAG: hypothetical protein QOJ53_157 [Sphingomonadales bacterium]|jgi:Flp pilus assembly protein TadD|nr:hypothetical protein [Sphingomonadales bacterium]
MNRTAFKLAASTAIVAMTMVGATSPSGAVRRSGQVQGNSPTDRQAVQLHGQAARALQQGQLGQALSLMEQVVALSPRDVGYRLLLADIYLKSGRFDSARATYSDAIELDPSNVRAGLSVALIQIAQGRPAAAVAILDGLEGRAPAADLGLAYALAGRADHAVEILESAARSPMATPRTRQNLALAYAFAGDWRRARAIAAQDISPADIDARMAQWARLARPGAGSDQVASLLGVSPGADPGQPVRLALAPAAAPRAPALAEAAPPPAPAAQPRPPVQVAAAQAPPAEAPAFWVPTAQSYQPAPAPAPAAEAAAAVAEVRYDVPAISGEGDGPAPASPVLPPAATPVRSAAQHVAAPPAPARTAAIRATFSAPLPAAPFQRARAGAVRSGNAPVVVQLGAFSNEANAERAWVRAERRYGLQGRRPLTTTIAVNGRTLHRVSVSGFASAADAWRLCGQVRGQGGVCFVRGPAGDASIRWAARYANPRQRNV